MASVRWIAPWITSARILTCGSRPARRSSAIIWNLPMRGSIARRWEADSTWAQAARHTKQHRSASGPILPLQDRYPFDQQQARAVSSVREAMIDLICRRVCCMFAVAAWTASGYAAESEPYPNKAVRMIVPFPPGGTNDIFGRLVAQKFSESGGQPGVVDNRGGAGGILATTLAAQAPPDGYTMLVAGIGFSVNPSLFKKLPYDTGKDLVPVTLIALTPLLLVVHPSLPVKSLQDLIGYAKSNPGKLNFGSGGSGSAPQLAGEMFKSMAGIQITHVPYKGGGPALADVMGGQIQMMIENVASTLPQVKAGKLTE